MIPESKVSGLWEWFTAEFKLFELPAYRQTDEWQAIQLSYYPINQLTINQLSFHYTSKNALNQRIKRDLSCL